MKIVSYEKMAEIDLISQNKFQIPSSILMENAGQACFTWIYNRFPPYKHNIYILCGNGNNSGDGFVIARYLFLYHYNVKTITLFPEKSKKGDLLINSNIANNLKIPDISYESLLNCRLTNNDVIIDSIFGTGIKGELKGKIKDIILKINETNCYKIAIDIPSGLPENNNTNVIFNADTTLTIGLPKTPMYILKNRPYCGNIKVCKISFPPELFKGKDLTINLVTKTRIKKLIKKRNDFIYKNKRGHLLLMAGSQGMTGAANLASLAALRSGCGLVTCLVNEQINNTIAKNSPEIMTLLESNKINDFKRYSAFVIGPGLGNRTADCLNLIKNCLKNFSKILIDADGLKTIKQFKLDQLSADNKTQQIVLTPHPGEFSNLSGISKEAILNDSINIVKRYAREHKIYLILKGACSIIGTPQGNVYIYDSPNQALATAGSGDVLSGIIGSFMAQGYDALSAILIGIYLHSESGKLAKMRYSKNTVIAGDLIHEIHNII